MPMTPLTGDIGTSDLAVLERWADPNALLRAGKARLTAVIAEASHGQQGTGRAEEWLRAARAAVDLYGGDSAVAFADLAAEVATEVRLLRATQAELDSHAAVREDAYRRVDPEELARSLPGVAEVIGPVLVAAMARPGRFARGEQFKSFTGLVARASETGESDRKGQPMSKAEAEAIIAEHWTVPEEVRRRRRHKKVGKVPHQVLVGHVSRARSAVPRRPSPPASSVPEAVASTTQEGGA